MSESNLKMYMVTGGSGGEAVRGTRYLLEQIAKVHEEAFPGFFLTAMGHRFLEAYYGSVLAYEGGLLVVGESDGQIVGFAAGLGAPSGFYKFLRGRAITFLIPIVLGVLRRPGLLSAAARGFVRTRKQSIPVVGETGDFELTSLAVRPSCGGRGWGRELVQEFCRRAVGSGANRVVLTTDAEGNDRVNRFYQDLGFISGARERRSDGRIMQHYSWQSEESKS